MEIEEIEKVEESQFPFTNYTDEEFTAKWDGQEYTFPAKSTVSMLGMIPSASPLEIQSIRKKFANDLGTEVFYGSNEYKKFDVSAQLSEEGKSGKQFSERDFAPFVQRCLEPLPVKKAEVKTMAKKEVPLSKDEKGKPVSRVLEEGESLIQGNVVA